MARLTPLLVILLLTCFATMAMSAPPTADYLYPSGGQRGQIVDVSVKGTFAKWPIDAHAIGEGVRVEAAADKNKLKIHIDSDAPCGTSLIRFHDAEGATRLCPFVVGTTPELMEKEPNDAPDAAQPIEQAVVVNGKLGKGGDVDGYQLEIQAGQTLVASMLASRVLNSPMDAVLQVCDAQGFVIEQNDDELSTDPQIVFTAPTSGTYIVRAFAFPKTANSTIAFSGADNYVYRLTITTQAFVDFSLPLAVKREAATTLNLFGWNLADDASFPSDGKTDAIGINVFLPAATNSLYLPTTAFDCVVATDANSVSAPQSISIPSAVSGVIEEDGDVDAFQFDTKKGETLICRVEARALGYRIDPAIAIVDSAGKQLSEADDTKKDADPTLTWKVPADGTYQFQIRDLHRRGGERYVYRVFVERPTPTFTLSLASDVGTVTKDKPLEVIVNVSRTGGFQEEIAISVEGLGDGMTCEAVKSAAKGDSAKSVKLKIVSDGSKAFSGAIRIIGNSQGDTKQTTVARFPIPETPLQIDELWLTTAGK